MASLYGILGLEEGTYALINDVGQRMVFDAVNELADRHNADIEAMTRLLVERETTEHTMRYFLPGAGRMQESTPLSRPGAVKQAESYTVAFEIRDGRDQVAWDDVAAAYATVEQVNLAVKNVMIRHANWVRYHLLRSLFIATSHVFADPINGDLTIQPLANGDAVVYPPVIGAENGATDNHYLAPNYTTSPEISDTNNPFTLIYDELAEHFGNSNAVALVNPTQFAEVDGMTGFTPVGDPFIRAPLVASAISPGIDVPGEIKGRVGNVWISEWRWMPENYILGIDLDQPPPLVKRVDKVALGGRGRLELIAQQTEFPLQESFWRDRRGYGVGNRLSAVVLKVNGASYTTPAGYA